MKLPHFNHNLSKKVRFLKKVTFLLDLHFYKKTAFSTKSVTYGNSQGFPILTCYERSVFLKKV